MYYNGVLLFLNLGTQEVILIVFAVLLLFGGNKLPELARGLGKGIREFKDASDGVKREIHRNINTLTAEEELKREEEAEKNISPSVNESDNQNKIVN
jgi:sec-independent protein translocase protein TatA